MFKFHKHTFVFIALIWLCSLNRLMAQKVKPADFGIKSKKALELYMQGQQNDQWRDRKTAINFYLQATAIEPEFGMAWYAAAEDNYLLQNYKAGLVCIENAFKFYKPPPPVLTFFLAEFNFYNLNYDRAAKFYQAFLDAKPPVTKKIADEAVFNLRNSIFAAAEIKKPVKFELKNLGPGVNTIGEEYLPNLTADDQIIFFTTRRPGCTGDYMAEMRGYGEDFYFSNLGKENQWMDAINLGPPVNTSLN